MRQGQQVALKLRTSGKADWSLCFIVTDNSKSVQNSVRKSLQRCVLSLPGRCHGDKEMWGIGGEGYVSQCEPVWRHSGTAKPHGHLSHPYMLLGAVVTRQLPVLWSWPRN